MEITDFLELVKNPTKFEAQLKQLEDAKNGLEAQAAVILGKARDDAERIVSEAETKAVSIRKEAQAAGEKILAAAKAEMDKAEKLRTEVGYLLDQARTKARDALVSAEEAAKREKATLEAYAAAKKEQAEATLKHNEITEKLSKINEILK